MPPPRRQAPSKRSPALPSQRSSTTDAPARPGRGLHRPGRAGPRLLLALMIGVALLATAAVAVVRLEDDPAHPLDLPLADDVVVRTDPAPPAPEPPTTPAPLLFRNATVTLQPAGFYSWAVMDRRSGEIWGSANFTETTWPASMIKSWIAADYLRRTANPSSAVLLDVERMIRDSDNGAAIRLHSANGGSSSIRRMVSLCQLTDTSPATAGGWSFTNISARDTVRLADCIGDGTAAGPKWTEWLLKMMNQIRIGDWGIRKALPPIEASGVAIKNGWLRYDDDGLWHINCLAVADTWAMAVLQRYRGTGNWNRDYEHGQQVCRDTAIQLVNPAYTYARPA